MTALLHVEKLRKSFGGLAVTQDVSITIAAGERVALIGPNGAGKTTFVNLVTGHLRPDGGSVLLGGVDATAFEPTRRVRLGLSRSFQVTRLFPSMTPREHLGLAVMQRRGIAGRMFGDYLANSQVTAEIDELLGLLALEAVADRKLAEIAYGLQRLLEIALALALKPKVLLLDEPAAGVPQSDTPRIDAALTSLSPELAVLMIDHDMDLVFRFATRVVVLAAGAVIFDGSPSEVTGNQRVREAYLGTYADDRSAA
jgi:branched-chain amino acid transport system ATP-binding protein